MFVAKAYLSLKAGEREYQIICDNNAPLDDLLNVLDFAVRHVQKLKDERAASEKKENEVESEQGSENLKAEG